MLKLKWLLPLAATATLSTAHAQSVSFGATDGMVTSVEFEEIVFQATAAYENAVIALLIPEAFPETPELMSAMFESSSIIFKINETTHAFSGMSFGAFPLGSGSPAAAFFSFIDEANPITLNVGDTISFSGSASLASEYSPSSPGLPISGDYTAVLVADSLQSLADPITVDVGVAIPEPSTYALFFGAGALGVVAVRRRLQKGPAAR